MLIKVLEFIRLINWQVFVYWFIVDKDSEKMEIFSNSLQTDLEKSNAEEVRLGKNC